MERPQYLVFISLSIVIVVLTGIIYFSDNLLFQRFIGGINPLIASFFLSCWMLFLYLSSFQRLEDRDYKVTLYIQKVIIS